MSTAWKPLTEEEKKRYQNINKENLEFLMNRYNKVNRWVIGDMIRRSAYHYPEKPALIFKDRTLTYAQLEEECNRVANGLLDLGVKKYDRVAILAHNTIDHVVTWIGCPRLAPSISPSTISSGGRTSLTASTTRRARSSLWRTPSSISSRMSLTTCPR